MCGIAGVFSPSHSDNHSSTVKLMTDSILHRGPDGSGIWNSYDNRCTLGHRRLSIIDLSLEGGSQPMKSHDGNFVITFNGEIYNYKELRDELKKINAVFRGTSDTEVLLEAFSAWGIENTVKRLVGMFAFALWDTRNNLLFLFRDRVGKKPLYYTIQNGKFWFASEIKAFNKVSELSLTTNDEAISHYLSLAYVPSPMTVYQEIRKIPPGSIITVDMNLNLKTAAYWKFSIDENIRIERKEAVERVDTLLNDAVKLRMRSDVPVGVFLSGGIDSGLITAMASRCSNQPVKTFSAKFSKSEFDESSLARQVARRYNTNHYELEISPKLDTILPKIASIYDEPFADPSAIPTFAIAQEASKYVKVVLNGEGSDEIFGGYRRHSAMHYYTKIKFFLDLLPNHTWRQIHNLLPYPKSFRTPYSFLNRFIRGFGVNPYERYLLWGSDGFNEKEKNSFGLKYERKTVEFLCNQFKDLNQKNPLTHFMAVDFLSGMSDCLLTKVDIATMANSLEGRSPFLDHRLIDFSSSIDRRDLVTGKVSKPILRDLASKYLPNDIINAPKRGFEIPLVEWTNGPLKDMIGDLCLDSQSIVMKYFDKKYISDIVNGRGVMDSEMRAKRLWILLMLALWDVNKI